MRLIDIINGPWAIAPQMLLEIQGIYATHLRGEKIDIEGVESRLGRKLDNRHETFQIVDGVAVIPIEGAIAKRMNLFTRISGGASTELIQRDIEIALADRTVRAIVLAVDSPGGTVDGTAELGEYIYSVRGQKPIIAYSDGMICSAAYWIASAADSIWISADTNSIGSIGVVAAHRDYSKWEERIGVKTTEITAGKYKRMSSQYEPLSEAGRADIQGKLDYLYSGFVDTVARNRGTTSQDVIDNMADGRVFIGRQSISAGLVDGVTTMDQLIDQLSAGEIPQVQRKKSATADGDAAGNESLTSTMEVVMTREELQAKHPELYQQLLDEGKQQAIEEKATAVAAAAGAESTRVLAIVKAGFGDEAGDKVAKVVDKGLAAEDLDALGISFTGSADQNSVDAETRAQILAGLKEAGNEPLGKTNGQGTETFEQKVDAYRKENKCGRGTAVKAIANAYPELHAAYLDGNK